jgi:hypothetical protein
MRRRESAIGFFGGTGREQYVDGMLYSPLSEISPFLGHAARGPRRTTFPVLWSWRRARRTMSQLTSGHARANSTRVNSRGEASDTVSTSAAFAPPGILTCVTLSHLGVYIPCGSWIAPKLVFDPL